MENKPQTTTTNNSQLQTIQLPAASQTLVQHLAQDQTMQIKLRAVELAPQGKPDFNKIFEKGQTASLRVIEKQVKPVLLAGIISKMIDGINSYFNVVRPMTNAQIEELTIDMMQLKDHRLEDFLAFFEGIKKGRYGKIYDRLDQSVIWEMWDKYEEERESYFYNQHKQAKDDNVHDARTVPNAATEAINKLSSLGSGIQNLKQHLKKNEPKI